MSDTLREFLDSKRALVDVRTRGRTAWFTEGAEVRVDFDPYATDEGIGDCTAGIAHCYERNDARFIADADTTVPILLDMVRVMSEALGTLTQDQARLDELSAYALRKIVLGDIQLARDALAAVTRMAGVGK